MYLYFFFFFSKPEGNNSVRFVATVFGVLYGLNTCRSYVVLHKNCVKLNYSDVLETFLKG